MATTHFSGPVQSLGGFTTTTTIPAAGGMVTTSLTTTSLTTTTSTITGSQFQGPNAANGAGGDGVFSRTMFNNAAIPDTTATLLATITIPNAAHSAIFRLLFLSTLNGANANESTRVVEYLLTVSRKAGANAVGVLSAAIGAQISTVAAGATLTTTPAIGAVVGAVGAVNTLPINISNVCSVAQVSQTIMVVEEINDNATGITIA